jgi:KDO2-lipid IV(A) lauroyltransferase
MPGQKSQAMPFLHGHLRLPVGPVKLALASGSPIIPIFTVMTAQKRCRVFIEPAIEVAPDDPDAAMRKIADSIQKFVGEYPEQWLVLHPAFVEDDRIDLATENTESTEKRID